LVSAKLDVVTHLKGVHPDELNRKGIDNKFNLDGNCTVDDVKDAFFGKAVVHFGV
jgi:hypothetical protein